MVNASVLFQALIVDNTQYRHVQQLDCIYRANYKYYINLTIKEDANDLYQSSIHYVILNRFLSSATQLRTFKYLNRDLKEKEKCSVDVFKGYTQTITMANRARAL